MFKKLLLACVCAAVLISAGTGLWVWQGLKGLEKPVEFEEPLLFQVPQGASFTEVAGRLEDEGLVSDRLWLRLYGRLDPGQTRIKAGEYEFLDGMSSANCFPKNINGNFI